MARSQISAMSVTPSRSRRMATDCSSQASWPSWLPGTTTTRWFLSAPKRLTASVNCGCASRIPATSGAAASISNPSPAMTSIPGRWKVLSTLASSSAALVDTSDAVGARCRSLTTTPRLPRPTSSRRKSGTRTDPGSWSVAWFLPPAGRPSTSRLSSRVVMSRLRAHDRERNDVTDGRDLSQQHDQPVDAEADARGRRQPVLERPDEGQVGGHGLGVSAGGQRGLGLEPLFLLVGVVELAVAVGQLPAPDEQLEAVGGGGGLAGLAGQRRDLGGGVVDEHRAQGLTHQDLVVELEDQLARPPRRLVVGAVRVAHLAQLGHGHARGVPRAEFLLGQVEEVPARPRRGQVDLLAAEVELEPADGPAGGLDDQLVGQVPPDIEGAEGAGA